MNFPGLTRFEETNPRCHLLHLDVHSQPSSPSKAYFDRPKLRSVPRKGGVCYDRQPRMYEQILPRHAGGWQLAFL